MSEPAIDDGRLQVWAGRAAGFAEALLAEDLGAAVRAELLGQSTAWLESRLIAQHHLCLWSFVTDMTVVLDEEDHWMLVGWQIDKRMASSALRRLSDDELARIAVGAQPGLALDQVVDVRTEMVDAVCSFSIVTLSGPQQQRTQVYVNHSTGQLIGCLPSPVGTPRSFVPAEHDDPTLAQHAIELGRARVWELLTATLAERLEPAQVEQAASIFSFTPLSAMRDRAGRISFVYRLWSRFTTADVVIDTRDDAVVAWYLESRQSEAGQRLISLPQAIEAATPHLLAVVGVQGPTAEFDNVGGEQQVIVHWWHAEADCNIEGDQTTVLVNAESGQVFSVARKWRAIAPALLAVPRISAAQALEAADKAHGAGPGPGASGRIAGRSVIEIGGDASNPQDVRDVAVWRVAYSGKGGIGLTEWSIDCESGQPVRITGW